MNCRPIHFRRAVFVHVGLAQLCTGVVMFWEFWRFSRNFSCDFSGYFSGDFFRDFSGDLSRDFSGDFSQNP